MEQPILHGIRVLDLSTGIAGPMCAMTLAEAGADVIKVEPPEGDRDRALPGFAVWNRSKRSVVLDIADPSGRPALDALLGAADVLVHSYSRAQAEALEIDDASLAARYPGLIVCGLTAWPQGHPNEDMPLSDTLMLAESGLMDEQKGVRRDGPIYIRFPLGSWTSSHLATIGVLARLIHRDRGGSAGPAHTSLLQGALVPLGMVWYRATTPTEALSRGLPKDMQPSIFECGDGVWLHIMTPVHETPMMKAAFDALGPEGVAEADEAAKTSWSMFPHIGAVRKLLKTKPHREWLEHFWQHDIAVQPAVPLGRIYTDEQARENGYVIEVEDVTWGRTMQPGTPFATTPPSAARHGLRPLGADTEAVLSSRPAAKAGSGGRATSAPPLAGLKVLDLGSHLAGPLGTALLSDLGADVIKLESVDGDKMRWIEGPFVGCQRGKRDIALQLKSPESRPVIEKLVAWADIVHHNMRLPAARKLGVDYDTFRALKPELIYCHVSAYGPQGPRRDWPGMDQMFQASTGWEYEGAGKDNRPMWHRYGFTDHLAAMSSVEATLLALYHRDRTGQGQFVTASLLGASLQTVSETVLRADGTLTPLPQLDSLQLGLGPFERIYELADGWIAISEQRPEHQRAVLAELDVEDPAALEAILSKMSADGVVDRLQARGVGVAHVRLNNRVPFFSSPDNRKAGLIASYPHPVYGTFEQIGAFWNFGDLPLKLDRAPPGLGQHTTEILEMLGYSATEIEGLKDSKTVLAA